MQKMLRLEDVFKNTEYLRVLYFLAKENPRKTGDFIAQKLGITKELAEKILLDIAFFQLARNEAKNGFTLTDEGLAMLYNFHKNYAEKPN